jgi:hypothetical protein
MGIGIFLFASSRTQLAVQGQIGYMFRLGQAIITSYKWDVERKLNLQADMRWKKK